MEEKTLSNNDKYILEGLKLLKKHKITAYALHKLSKQCHYPISYPTIKKIYSQKRIPEKHVIYLGLLDVIEQMVMQIKNRKDLTIRQKDI